MDTALRFDWTKFSLSYTQKLSGQQIVFSSIDHSSVNTGRRASEVVNQLFS